MCEPGFCRRCGKWSSPYGHFCVWDVRVFDRALSEGEVLQQFRRWKRRGPRRIWLLRGLVGAQVALLGAMFWSAAEHHRLWFGAVVLWFLSCWLLQRERKR